MSSGKVVWQLTVVPTGLGLYEDGYFQRGNIRKYTLTAIWHSHSGLRATAAARLSAGQENCTQDKHGRPKFLGGQESKYPPNVASKNLREILNSFLHVFLL